MNASRLLFEGLEDRILLDANPAAVVGATIQTESYSHAVPFVSSDTDISFTLPKFDDQGGTRTLVSVQIDGHYSLTNGNPLFPGALETENVAPTTGTLNELTLTFNVDATVSTTPPFGVPTYTFDTSSISRSLAGTPVTIGPAGPLTWTADGPAPWNPLTDPPDFYSVSVGGAVGDMTQVVLSNNADLANFIQSPGDTVIQYDASSSMSSVVDYVGTFNQTRTLPAQYTLTGTVTYSWVETSTRPSYTDETYRGPMLPEFEPMKPQMFQPFFSGTAQPGSTLAVDILGAGGEVLGSTSTIVDAGGNWTASFYDTEMTGQPSTLSIRQLRAGYTPLLDSGYNLRRYFSPAVLGGAYASEVLTVDNVMGKRATTVAMSALYSVSAHPTTLGLAPYVYEMLPMSASPQGLY